MKCRSSRWPRWRSARPRQLQLRRGGRLPEPLVNGPVDEDDVSLRVVLISKKLLSVRGFFFSALLFFDSIIAVFPYRDGVFR